MKRLLTAALCLLLLTGCAEKPDRTAETPVPAPSLSPLPTPGAAPTPVPSPGPTPLPTPDPIPVGPFATLLAGDTSGILDPEDRGHVDWLFSNVTSPSFNPILEISSLWGYTLLDLDGDGEDELFLRPRDAWYTHLIFDARPEGLELVGQKTIRMSDWTDPLSDGRILDTVHYDGMYTYTIRDLSSQEEDVWTYRYEDRLYYVGEEPESPAWTHNGQPITEMEFNEQFQQPVNSLQVTDWCTAAIPDTISVTAGVFEPLLRGDLSRLSSERREYIQTVFSVDWDWEYALMDLDGDGKEELFLRVKGIPAGSRREVTTWTTVENEDGNGPARYHGSPSSGMPVTWAEFENFLRSCQEKRIPYWNTVHFHFDKEEN